MTRRTIFELRKARDRARYRPGSVAIALANIDPIIELIRRAPAPAEAKAALISSVGSGQRCCVLERAGDDTARRNGWANLACCDGPEYYLTERKAQAILDLRLQKPDGLEHEKLLDSTELLEQIAELLHILGSAVA